MKTAAFKWQDGDDAVTARWQIGGWPLMAGELEGLKHPCRRGRHCRRPAEWKIERRRGDSVRTAWYCVKDLPSTEAPPVDAEEIE